MRLKKTISFFISLNLIFSNYLFALDGYYDTNNTMPNKPNAECYFIFDKLAAPACDKLYKDNNGDINKMMNNQNVFYQCLVSNCGLYQTDSAHYKESYQYKMEVVKKCVLDKEDTLTYSDLSKSDWFVDLATNLDENPSISTSSTQTRFIPFKVFKYKCPKFKVIQYQKKERVLQYPVLCFKSDSNSSLNDTILNCLKNNDISSCQKMTQETGGNLKAYIKYVYCDKDADGDGFPESLSSAQQAQCHRSDAASLRCQKNQICSDVVTCAKETDKTVETNEYKTCKNLTRNYHDYTINTQCGDISDIYQNNPNCIRINSVTDAREEGIEYYNGTSTNNLNKPIRYIEVRNYGPSMTVDEMHSYHEYVMYQKKDGTTKKRFVALVYPEAIYKKKSSYTVIGNILNLMTGGLVAVAEGDASFIGPEALGAGFVTHSSKIPNTVVDNILRDAINDGYKVTTNKDIKNVTYKVKKGHGIIKRKIKMWFMKAWWDPTIVESTNLANPVSSDWIWDGYRRKNIHYYFKIKANPNDVLVFYGINAKGNRYATSATYYKKHTDVSCNSNGVDASYAWKKMQTAANYPIKSPSIQNMTMFLTYPSIYLFQFYNGNNLVFSKYKNFGITGNYPVTNLDIASLSSNSDDFSTKLTQLYNQVKPEIINDAVNQYMDTTEVKNEITRLVNSLMDTFKYRNIDEVKKQAKKFTKYSYFNDFFNFYAQKKALDYYVNNSFKDNVCYSDDTTANTTPAGSDSGVTNTDENTFDNFNNDISDYRSCLLANPTEAAEINSSVNSDSDLLNLDAERFAKLKEYTNDVYSDLTSKIKSNINSYLNKSPDNYSLSNDMGSWTMSFKSKCGDYSAAKLEANTYYDNGLNDITKTYFSTQATGIKNGLISLIDSHMQDETLKYKYKIFKRTGTSKWDVDNDWDKQCSADYTYYTTEDNGGSGSAHIYNTASHFNSFGDYTCDEKSLTATGNPSKYCQTSGHDLKHFNYVNEFQGYGYWSSIAKKLDETTTEMKGKEDTWLVNNHYRDYAFINNTIWDADANGYNNVRVNLSTDSTNGITTETDKYIKPLITTYVTNQVKEFLKEKITYKVNNDITGDPILDPIKENETKTIYQEALDDSTANHSFQPFNKVVIKDVLADPDSPYAINDTIETPGDILVKNPDALNIVMLPFPVVRKYRCYDENFSTCSYKNQSGCTLDSFYNYDYVSDFTGKRIPTLRSETYKCKKKTSIPVCAKYQVKKSCYNTNIGEPYIEFDDDDFSKDFGKTVGENLAFNEAIHIFNGKELQCQKGLFTDFSWMTDPAFLAQVAQVAAGYIMTNTPAGKALTSWLSGASDSPANPCAGVWLRCMASHGSSVSNVLQTGVSSSATCDQQTRNTEGCRSFSGVNPLAAQINSLMNNSFVQTINNPAAALAIQVAYNLAFNTFDKCNQCINKKCASSHKPKQAETLYKMTDGKAKLITGAEYGLGPDFKAYGQCFYKDSKCAKHFFGMCLRRAYNYCCYNTKIARILAGQMYEQLGLNYATNGCSAIKITDLTKIDFSPCNSGTIPSPTNKCINYKELEDYINSKINWNLKGSFDMNKLIQAVMDEGAN